MGRVQRSRLCYLATSRNGHVCDENFPELEKDVIISNCNVDYEKHYNELTGSPVILQMNGQSA